MYIIGYGGDTDNGCVEQCDDAGEDCFHLSRHLGGLRAKIIDGLSWVRVQLRIEASVRNVAMSGNTAQGSIFDTMTTISSVI